MYHLVRHPEALQAVRQEIQDTLTLSGIQFSHDKDLTLNREQLDKLLYLGISVQTTPCFVKSGA